MAFIAVILALIVGIFIGFVIGIGFSFKPYYDADDEEFEEKINGLRKTRDKQLKKNRGNND